MTVARVNGGGGGGEDSGSVAVQSIEGWVTIGDDIGFRLKSAEVDRQTGRTVGQATIKGIMDDPDAVTLGDEVQVWVDASASEETPNESLDSYAIIFTGEAHSAKQNEKGVVTIEAYDAFEQLQTKTVKLNTEEERYADEVLRDLLEDTYGSVAYTDMSASPDSPFVAPREDFPLEPSPSIYTFGSAERGDPLINVVEQLVDTLGATMYVNRYGELRITDYPDHEEWETPLITEINAGEETRNAETIIFEATGNNSEFGGASSFVQSQTSHTSESRIPGEDEPEAPTEVLSDDNVTTQEEADGRSYSEGVNQDQQRDFGNIQIIGNADIELYDEIIVPELEFTSTGYGGVLNDTLYEEGQFKVDGIVHTVDATDGFLTKLKLSPSMGDTLNNVQCTAADIGQNYLGRYNNSVQGQSTSGQDDSSGFLSDLFGGFL